jgi:hypothetical protein
LEHHSNNSASSNNSKPIILWIHTDNIATLSNSDVDYSEFLTDTMSAAEMFHRILRAIKKHKESIEMFSIFALQENTLNTHDYYREHKINNQMQVAMGRALLLEETNKEASEDITLALSNVHKLNNSIFSIRLNQPDILCALTDNIENALHLLKGTICNWGIIVTNNINPELKWNCHPGFVTRSIIYILKYIVEITSEYDKVRICFNSDETPFGVGLNISCDFKGAIKAAGLRGFKAMESGFLNVYLPAAKGYIERANGTMENISCENHCVLKYRILFRKQ